MQHRSRSSPKFNLSNTVLALIFSLAAIVVLLAVAVSPAEGQGFTVPQSACASSDELPHLRYVNFQVIDPVFIAADQGFYEQLGLCVVFTGGNLAGPTAIQAVASGQAEGGLSSIPALVNANAAGLPVIGVVDVQSAFADTPLEEFYVTNDSTWAGDPEWLRGKTVAVNLWRSSFHYTLLLYLEAAGVPESEVNFVLLPFPTQADALMNGDVDLIGLIEPHITRANALYDMTLAFTAYDVFGERQFSVDFLNRVWAASNPELASAFVEGTVQAIYWSYDHPDETRAILSRYTGIDPEHIPEYRYQDFGAVITDDVQFWIDTLLRRGDIGTDDGVAPDLVAGDGLFTTWVTPDLVGTNAYNPFLVLADNATN